jgi:hypothetical protein
MGHKCMRDASSCTRDADVAHIELDEYYLEEQDEPTVRERLGLDARTAPRGRVAGSRGMAGAAGRSMVRPAAVVVKLPPRDDRLPLVA